jgi:hypothetical protein
LTACTNIHGGSTFVRLKTTYDAEWVDCLSGGSTNLHGGSTFIRLKNAYDDAEWVNVYKC